MGFRTLAIQKRSSEVWETLGAVKTEFENYAKLMDAVKKKLDEASNTIDRASVRTRVINRKLRDVEKLSDERANTLLPLLSADTVDKNELIEEASE
jgi:DNA recombination protein RmuC